MYNFRLISVRKDDYAFFLEPVDPEKVPGYLDAIGQPMDFGTMTEKVAKSKYRSLDEFTVRMRFIPRVLSPNKGPSIEYYSSFLLAGRFSPRDIQRENVQSPGDDIPH
jgi:hypothetical protein